MFNLVMDEEGFWQIIKELKWPGKRHEAKEKLQRCLPKRRHQEAFVSWHERKVNFLLQRCGEARPDVDTAKLRPVASHIVALGPKKWKQAFDDPEKVFDRLDKNDFRPDFTESIPSAGSYDSPKVQKVKMGLSLQGAVDSIKAEIVETEKKLFNLRRNLTRKINELNKLKNEE